MEIFMNIVTFFGGAVGLMIGFLIIGLVMAFAFVPFAMFDRTKHSNKTRDRVNTPESRAARQSQMEVGSRT